MKKDKKFFDFLSPKKLIINTIKSKLEGSGIKSIIFIFYLETEKYNLMVQNEDNQKLTIQIDQEDINTIKKMYLSRIVSKWKEKYNDEPYSIIIQFDLDNESFEMFVENTKKDILKFEF